MAALLVVTATSASSYVRPGRTERVSYGWDGMETLLAPTAPTISGDGRLVTFQTALAMVPGDTNGVMDVYVRDRHTGALELAAMSAAGEPGNGESTRGIISADGRFLVFSTQATNLLPDGEVSDLVLKDLRTGAVEAVAVSTMGGPPDDVSGATDISADGRYVVFDSVATNLIEGDTNGYADVYLFDRTTGIAERVSVDDAEGQFREASDGASVSDDGRFVAFMSERSTPPVDAAMDARDMHVILVRDRIAGTTSVVSVAPDGSAANGWSSSPAISNDGRFVAFSSSASNLVPNDANRANDVFVRDLVTGITERITVGYHGEGANGGSGTVAMTGDGRYVAFTSLASNLDPNDTVQCIPTIPPKVPGSTDRYSCRDAFVHDRLTGITERVSVGDDGSAGSTNSHYNSISEDGRFVAFSTGSTNLVAGDTNGDEDVFVRDRGPGVGVAAVNARDVGGGLRVSGWATFSGAPVSSAPDEPADAGPGASAAGLEMTDASLVYRHEERSLLVRVQVADVPTVRPPNVFGSGVACVVATGCPPGAADAPAFSYGLAFDHENITWRALAMRTGTHYDDPHGTPAFSLYRCDELGCMHAARLRGSWFMTGNEVRMVLPLVQIEGEAGDPLTNVRAYTGVGEGILGTQEIDSATLPDGTVPTARVEIGVVRGSAPASVGSVMPFGGLFERVVTASELGGDRQVAARGCLDATCGPWAPA